MNVSYQAVMDDEVVLSFVLSHITKYYHKDGNLYICIGSDTWDVVPDPDREEVLTLGRMLYAFHNERQFNVRLKGYR